MGERLATWTLAWLAGAGLLALAALVVVEAGLFDSTAVDPHAPPVAWAVHTTFVRFVQRNAGDAPPPPLTRAAVEDGFRAYDESCAQCHGGPGVDRAAWTSGMNPTPPYLIDAARQFTPAQLYFILDHGVKMTGMPSWRGVYPRERLWSLVGFLRALPYVSPAEYAQLRAAAKAK